MHKHSKFGKNGTNFTSYTGSPSTKQHWYQMLPMPIHINSMKGAHTWMSWIRSEIALSPKVRCWSVTSLPFKESEQIEGGITKAAEVGTRAGAIGIFSKNVERRKEVHYRECRSGTIFVPFAIDTYNALSARLERFWSSVHHHLLEGVRYRVPLQTCCVLALSPSPLPCSTFFFFLLLELHICASFG